MLKVYDRPEDIPEGLREHYSRREDGKYHADIPDEHPAVRHNARLVREKNDAVEAERTAKADLESARASSLPRGHEAVPKADADIVRAAKEAGITTVDAFTAMKDEHVKFKGESEAATREKHLREVAGDLGFEPEAFIRLPNLPEFERRDSTEKDAKGNPKKTAIAKVKGPDDVVTEKPGREYVEGHPDYKLFLASLKPAAQQGTSVHGSVATRESGGNFFDSIRTGVIEKEKAAAATDKTLEQRLNIVPA
jgi:hypothetical protein